MQIRIADEADLCEIQSLLRANDLPVEDISKTLIKGFLVAEGASGLFRAKRDKAAAGVFLKRQLVRTVHPRRWPSTKAVPISRRFMR
jgi:hypothetical protein